MATIAHEGPVYITSNDRAHFYQQELAGLAHRSAPVISGRWCCSRGGMMPRACRHGMWKPRNSASPSSASCAR